MSDVKFLAAKELIQEQYDLGADTLLTDDKQLLSKPPSVIKNRYDVTEQKQWLASLVKARSRFNSDESIAPPAEQEQSKRFREWLSGHGSHPAHDMDDDDDNSISSHQLDLTDSLGI